jgi:hypothetical protein
MAQSDTDDLYDDLFSIIQKDKTLADKKQLLGDLFIINDEKASKAKKVESYQRLIKYVSHLSQWNEELITYLGNRFARIKK